LNIANVPAKIFGNVKLANINLQRSQDTLCYLRVFSILEEESPVNGPAIASGTIDR